MCITDRPGLKFALGYAASQVVSVADGAEDVRVEVRRRPGGLITVEVPKAQLKGQR